MLFSHHGGIYTDSHGKDTRCKHQINNQQPTNQPISSDSQILNTKLKNNLQRARNGNKPMDRIINDLFSVLFLRKKNNDDDFRRGKESIHLGFF